MMYTHAYKYIHVSPSSCLSKEQNKAVPAITK